MKAEFFYRNPLKKGEPKPAFGVKEPDPDRPDHRGFMKEVFNAREEDHERSNLGWWSKSKSISQDWPWAKDTEDVQSHDSR